jgi:hypothetical protein
MLGWCGSNHTLHHISGGLWVRGVGEAALLCNPQFDYNDSYCGRVEGNKEYLCGWLTEDGVFVGAAITIESCEPWPVRPPPAVIPMPSEDPKLGYSAEEVEGYGIMKMVCNLRVTNVQRIERPLV